MTSPHRPRPSRTRRRPFDAYYRAWLATYARHHCKPGTVQGYEAAGRLYLIPAAGVPYAWPHCLRHTYASLLIQNGESLAYVKAQLGHRSIQTTVDVYGHLVAEANRAAVDRLDDAPA